MYTLVIVINVCEYVRVRYPRSVIFIVITIANVFGYLRVSHLRLAGWLTGRSPC